MRLPDAKIKEAILHADPDIRDRAATYFAKSYSHDPSIMPLASRAVETYGRPTGRMSAVGRARGLDQTGDTFAWVIDERADDSFAETSRTSRSRESLAHGTKLVMGVVPAPKPALISSHEPHFFYFWLFFACISSKSVAARFMVPQKTAMTNPTISSLDITLATWGYRRRTSTNMPWNAIGISGRSRIIAITSWSFVLGSKFRSLGSTPCFLS